MRVKEEEVVACPHKTRSYEKMNNVGILIFILVDLLEVRNSDFFPVCLCAI